MSKFKCKDNVLIDWKRSRFKPDEPQNGMAPAMAYIWVKLPTRDWYRVQGFRSNLQLQELFKTRTLDQIEILVDTEVL